MINPAGIPEIHGDMAVLAGHARELSTVGGAFTGTGVQVNSTWQGLAGVYDAPEVGTLLTATAPVASISASVGDDLGVAGSALHAYADEVAVIKVQLATLRTQASAFVASVAGDDDWTSDGDKVDRDRELIEAVNAQMAAFFEAQRRCANAINALYGGPQYTAEDGDGQVEPGEYGYTAEQLNAAATQKDALPWGYADQKDRGLLGDIGAFFGGAWDGAVQMVTGLGALIGRDPVTGEWSWSTAGTAWQGLGTFALAAGMYVMPGGAILDQTVGVPGFERGQLGNTLLTAGKSLIAYDQWGQDPARAAGTATFNIVSAVVGTKGAGAALRGVGAAAEGSRIAAVSVAGTALVRSGEFIARLPSVDDLVARAAERLPGFHLPDLSATPHIDVPHHVDLPSTHVDLPSTHVDLPSTHVDLPNGTRNPDLAPGTVGDALAHTPDTPSMPDTPPLPHGVDIPAQHISPLHTDLPAQHISPQHTDIPAQHADIPAQHAEVPAQHISPQHADLTGGARADVDIPAETRLDGNGLDHPLDRLIRQDDDFSRAVGPNGIPKSALDEHGNLVPANPEGNISPHEHVLGNRNPEAKGNSPFSSFFPEGHSAKLYGSQHVTLDYHRLQADIAAGHVRGVEVLSPDAVQRSVQDSIDLKAGRHVDVDLHSGATPLEVQRFAEDLGLSKRKTQSIVYHITALLNTRRDSEWLIRGIIPSDYLDGPHSAGS